MSYVSAIVCLHLPQSVHVVVPCRAVATVTIVLLQNTQTQTDRTCSPGQDLQPGTGQGRQEREEVQALTRQLRVGDMALEFGFCMCMCVGTTCPLWRGGRHTVRQAGRVHSHYTPFTHSPLSIHGGHAAKIGLFTARGLAGEAEAQEAEEQRHHQQSPHHHHRNAPVWDYWTEREREG